RESPSRAKMVRERKEIGYEGWRDKYKYGKRWINETTFSRAKREYGEYVTAVKWKNIVNEIKFQYAMLNVMLNGINVYSIV
ncbi:MAG: IS5/IS1182 family transposase, partial [Thermoplasmata archaeon]|nr:IS5/IS1182 family transposase [Thermoplasmata archaeon]